MCYFLELATPTSLKGAVSAVAKPHHRDGAEHIRKSLESSAPSSSAAPAPVRNGPLLGLGPWASSPQNRRAPRRRGPMVNREKDSRDIIGQKKIGA